MLNVESMKQMVLFTQDWRINILVSPGLWLLNHHHHHLHLHVFITFYWLQSYLCIFLNSVFNLMFKMYLLYLCGAFFLLFSSEWCFIVISGCLLCLFQFLQSTIKHCYIKTLVLRELWFIFVSFWRNFTSLPWMKRG